MAVTGCSEYTANQESPPGTNSALDSSSYKSMSKDNLTHKERCLEKKKDKYPMANYPDQKYPNALPGVPRCHITAVTSS